MPIRKTAYETTACNGAVINKIVHAIEDSLTVGWTTSGISTLKNNQHVLEVIFTNSISPVPAFFHPIIVKKQKGFENAPGAERLEEKYQDEVVVVDARSAGRYDEANREFKIRNQYEYSFISLYGELNDFWLHNNSRLLGSVSHLPVALFARWISENLTRRFGLTPQDQLTISILAAYFYLGQFEDQDKPDDRELQRLCGFISKAVYTNAQTVLQVIGELPYIGTVADLCSIAKETTGNVRLNDLNSGLLFAILGNSWYGNNARELVAVALEFPPAWILLTYASYTDRGYKNTAISKMSARDKKMDVDSFVRSLTMLLRHQ